MATERFAGGRGIALATQTNVNAKPARQNSGRYVTNLNKLNIPQYPVVIRNIEKYLPPVAMVDREII